MKENLYTVYKKTLQKALEKQKLDFYDKKLKAINTNSKKLWDFVHDNFRNKKEKGRQIETITVNGHKITNNFEKATHFNEFFINVGKNLSKRIKKTLNQNPRKSNQQTETQCFYLEQLKEKYYKLSRNLTKIKKEVLME